MFKDLTIQQFMEQLSSDAATPGGGTAAALSGSMSASLVSMVIRISTRKIKEEAIVDKFNEILENTDNLSREFLLLMDRDAEAFDRVMEAFKLPKKTAEQKEERKAKIQIALKDAALTPLKTMEEVSKVCKYAKEVMNYVPGSVISDIGVSALLSESALNGAYYNVLINLKYIKDEEFNRDLRKKAESIMNETKKLINEIKETIGNKMEGEK